MRKSAAAALFVVALVSLPALVQAPPSRAATPKPAAVTFFPNAELPCDLGIAGPIGCGQLLEPEAKSAPDGTIWVTAQEGAGGGVNMWVRDPKRFTYTHVAKIDGVPGVTDATGATPGGGDNELSISTDGDIQISTLNSLATIGMAVTGGLGEEIEYNPQVSNFVGVDRQWQATYGPDTVYLTYHDIFVSQVWMVKSTDGGRTFGAPLGMLPPDMLTQFGGGPAPGLGNGNIHSNLVTDRDGRVAFAFLAQDSTEENFTPLTKPRTVWVAVTEPGGTNPTVHKVFAAPVGTSLQGLFPAIAVDRAGNLYAAWSDLHGVYMSFSRDHAETWSAPIKVSAPSDHSAVFPYVIAGDAGRVGLAWLGSTAADPSVADAKYHVNYSYNLRALTRGTKWTQVRASDHVVHTGEICLEGLLCDVTGGNRNLAEVLQIGLTKDGRVLIAYPDDSNPAHLAGWSWIAEQNGGPGLYARIKPRPPKLPRADSVRGGILPGKSRKVGTNTYRFLPGSDSGSGVPNPDPAGGELDSPGDVGVLGSALGDDLHVASGNLWTTNFGGVPVAYDGPVLAKDLVLGGKASMTAWMQEPLSPAYTGSITATLLDVAPDGTETPIASGGGAYVADLSPVESSYAFNPAKPYEVLKGHHLRVEVVFTCFCSTDLRFYYGAPDFDARITVERFVRA
jgi:hypothetical protein